VEGLEDQLRKMKTQVDDLTRTNGELVNTRNRLTTENSDLQRQIHDLETNYGAFSKTRGQLQSQLDDAKSKLEEEIRVTETTALARASWARQSWGGEGQEVVSFRHIGDFEFELS